MFKGSFSPGLFMQTYSILMAITILIVYYISQVEGHEKRIAWISRCAEHYPEFVFFRVASISGSVLFALGWLTNYFYLKTVALEKVFRLGKYYPEITMILGMMAAFLLMGSTANIDTGIDNYHWHTTCALWFFFVCAAAGIYDVFICIVLQRATNALSPINLTLKVVFCLLIVIELSLNVWNGSEQANQLDNKFGIILEWLGSYTLITYSYLVGSEAKHFKFEFVNQSSIEGSVAKD